MTIVEAAGQRVQIVEGGQQHEGAAARTFGDLDALLGGGAAVGVGVDVCPQHATRTPDLVGHDPAQRWPQCLYSVPVLSACVACCELG